MPVVTKQTPNKVKPKSAKTGGVWDRIVPISELNDVGLKICVYGKSGTGKTTLWSTFPKPILAAICSGAGETRGIKKIPGIDAVSIQTVEEFSDLVAGQRETNKYKTFVLDHVTGYQDWALKKVLGVDTLSPQMTWGTATMSQWGDVGLEMKNRLRDAISLDCNVVIIGQERTFNDEGSSSEILAPYVNTALSPSVAGWLGPNVDYLVQTFLRMGKETQTTEVAGKKVSIQRDTGKVEYCLRVGPHSTYATKFRLARGTPLPDVIVNADYAKIVKLIDGGN